MKRKQYIKGMIQGIPIFLGYLSVSFGFGIMAVRSGLTVSEAAAMSLFNITSAGQAAGVGIIAAHGSIIEMILAQFTINLRYALMSLSLSQKLDRTFTTRHRLSASFGITDEIFALASSQEEPVTPYYMYGLILVSALGWVLGTFLGSWAGSILPQAVSDALGIMLYGMFIAIVVPPAKKEAGVLAAVITAALLSVIIFYLLPFISSGFSVMICGTAAAAAAALIFPRPAGDAESAGDDA